jgi:hydrogenase-4 component F
MIPLAIACLVVLPLAAAAAIVALRLRHSAGIVALTVTLVLMAAVAAVAVRVHERGPQYAFDDWIYVDSLSVIILSLTALVGACAVLNSLTYVDHEVIEGKLRETDRTRYFALLLTFMATMLAVPVLNNIGIMWVAIEATTVVSVLMVSIYRTGSSLEAAWKYLILGSVGIALALFGTMMTYYASASIAGDEGNRLLWTHLSTISDRLDPDVMRLAFIFVLVGYGTKTGLAPMHTWLPDAHSQAPSPISGLLSGVLLNCALYAILRFQVLTAHSAGSGFTDTLLIIFGMLSITVAIPFLLVQHDIKRMLAYHSVEHMGIITLAAGVGGEVALYAAMLHLVAHSLTKSALFFSSAPIVQAFRTRSMHRMRGLLRTTPLAGVGLLLGVFALAGFPPFAMFSSEYGLVSGAFQSHDRGAIGVAGILLATLAAATLLYHTIHIAYREPRPGTTATRLSVPTAASIVAPLVLLLWVSVAPPPIFTDTLNHAVDVLRAQ